jgi:hypothetical protein
VIASHRSAQSCARLFGMAHVGVVSHLFSVQAPSYAHPTRSRSATQPRAALSVSPAQVRAWTTAAAPGYHAAMLQLSNMHPFRFTNLPRNC